MSRFVSYILSDDSTIQIEISEPHSGGTTKASKESDAIDKARTSLSDSMASIKQFTKDISAELAELQMDEIEVQFSLKVTGEAGVFGISKVGGEGSIAIKLKHTRSSATKTIRKEG